MADSDQLDPALERGYNVRAPRSDFDALYRSWVERSDGFRRRAEGVPDLVYGPGERQRLDIFGASRGAPTLIYLHGGYWQSGDKSDYSFVAEPFVEHGVNVVLMGYGLCPNSSVPEITGDIRRGLIWLYRNGDRYGLVRERINLTGHSAGGHLTAMMLAARWNELDPQLPADLVKAGIPISGLYDLEPLRHTSINRGARIDGEAARHCSPLFLRPRPGTPVLAVVGGRETAAFHRQTRDFVEKWTAAGALVEQHVEPDVDHFDAVNRLADGRSALFEKTLDRLV